MPAHSWWEVVENEYLDLSDAYADSRNFTIEFQGVIQGSNRANLAAFKPYLTNYSDNWTSDWSGEQVFGRSDPIYTWRSTGRSISLGFKTVAASYGEAVHNMCNIQKLIKLQYPYYYSDGPELATTVSKGPLVRIKFANLIMGNRHDQHSTQSGGDQYPATQLDEAVYGPKGLLGVIKSLSCTPDLDEGMVEGPGVSALYPKVWSITLEFGVLHENILGWSGGGRDDHAIAWIGSWGNLYDGNADVIREIGSIGDASVYPYGIDQGCSYRHGASSTDSRNDPCPVGDCGGGPPPTGGPPGRTTLERPCDPTRDPDCGFDDNDRIPPPADNTYDIGLIPCDAPNGCEAEDGSVRPPNHPDCCRGDDDPSVPPPTTRTEDETTEQTRGCVVAGTLINTDRGLIPAEEITTEDKVYTYNFVDKAFGYFDVLATHSFFRNNIRRVVTEKDYEITCSADHPLWDLDRPGFELVIEDASVGDKVFVFEGGALTTDKIKLIEEMPEAATVYNFTIDVVQNYLSDNILSHNMPADQRSKGIARGDDIEAIRDVICGPHGSVPCPEDDPDPGCNPEDPDAPCHDSDEPTPTGQGQREQEQEGQVDCSNPATPCAIFDPERGQSSTTTTSRVPHWTTEGAIGHTPFGLQERTAEWADVPGDFDFRTPTGDGWTHESVQNRIDQQGMLTHTIETYDTDN